MKIPVIDLFSGPGGLGEGFANLDSGKKFSVVVSAEMDSAAHATLCLRSYFRLLTNDGSNAAPYYDYCHGTRREPTDSTTLSAWKVAEDEARQITLGSQRGNEELDAILGNRLKEGSQCVLIGGPPCQAYSLVGRARNRGKTDYRAEDDHRHFLYREYLRVIQRCRPAVFVMENVKGILSSHVGGRRIFHDILSDLVDPDAALTGKKGHESSCYRIHSLVVPTSFRRGMAVDEIDPHDFIIRAEEHGVPQARHRVILLGVREDIKKMPSLLEREKTLVKVSEAIGDLPRLRSKLSRTPDSTAAWVKTVKSHLNELATDARKNGLSDLSEALTDAARKILSNLEPGGIRVQKNALPSASHPFLVRALADPKLDVVLNHEARGHMTSDLRRYAYAATYADLLGLSPKGHEQFNLRGLAPEHANWESGNFADRFRVQLGNRPATTVTSHIAKDGHYFIHYDASQCRSLTVREAARLQTFPDNYFFQGNRTQQFHQVGNAVPPLLAARIAKIVQALM